MDASVADIISAAMTRAARVSAILVGLVALAILLVGYAGHVPAFIAPRPGLPGTSPLTALGLAGVAASIALEGKRKAGARWLGGLAVAIGGVALGTLAATGREPISAIVAESVFGFDPRLAGCTSGPTALCLLALGIAASFRDRAGLADGCGALALFIASFALFDELYEPGTLIGVPFFGPMAVRTAAAIVVLAIASLVVRPTQGWGAVIASRGPGGASTRRLVAFAPVPPLVGWLLVRVAEVDRLGVGPAMAALVVLTILPLMLLVLRGGRVLDALEEERRSRATLQDVRERELRMVADALPVLVAFVDPTLTYRFANRAYKLWTGRAPEQVVDRRIDEVFGEQGLELRRAHIDAALEGIDARFEMDWTLPDETTRVAEIRYLPRFGPEQTVEGFFIFVADITERKSEERRLVETQQALEERVEARTRERDQIWSISMDMLCIATFEDRFVSLNPAWTQTLGWPLETLLAEPFTSFVHPDDLAATRETANGLVRGAPVLAFENRYRHADGSYRWFSWNAVPFEDRIYATVRDITEAKAAASRERALEEALRQAQKMEAVGQLTGGLAHDFNNLLTGITGSLDLISRRAGQGRTADLERYVEAAQGAARRAAALTHRLLAFSRQQALDPRPTDIARLVAGMEDLVRRTVGPEVAVEIVTWDDPWRVLVDPNQLENALLNLCINARDAMPEGGRIVVETANVELDAATAEREELTAGPYVALRVTDTGTGMAPSVVQRIFDPFFTTKPMGQGTGLGLSMIYGFARQSGGQVTVRSQVGLGTTMTLLLPRFSGVDEGTTARGELPTSRVGHGETLLIVDDEATVRMLIVDVLEELGYRVLEAQDGAEGLAILRSDAPVDLLVTDIGLPHGMNGQQLAEAARRLRSDLRVLFITGYAETAAQSDGALGPGMRLLPKPFEMEALAALVREMLAA